MKRILILLLLILTWFVCIGETRTSKSSSGVYVFGSITGTILAEAEEASIDEVIDSCKTLKVPTLEITSYITQDFTNTTLNEYLNNST